MLAKGLYVGVNGTSKKVKKQYIGMDGVSRKVKKVYVGVNGKARLAWQNGLNMFQTPFNYSYDGINWVNTSVGRSSTDQMMYGDNKFIFASEKSDGIQVKFSHDGINWVINNTIPYPKQGYAYIELAYGNGIFLITGTCGYILKSQDCINWTVASGIPSYPQSTLSGVTYGNGCFLACMGVPHLTIQNYYSTRVLKSVDGLNWTEVATFSRISIGRIKYGKGRFVVVGMDLDNVARSFYSINGVEWVSMTGLPYGQRVSMLGYGNGKFITGYSSGNFAYSDDGVSWTLAPEQLPNNQSNPSYVYHTFGNGMHVAGYNKDIAYSTDGITWTRKKIDTFFINSLVFSADGGYEH